MSFGLRITGILLALALMPGCSADTTETPAGGDSTVAKGTSAETESSGTTEETKTEIASRSQIPKLDGRWKLVMSQGGYDLDICLVDVVPKTFDVKLVAVSEMLGNLKMTEAAAKDAKVHLTFDAGELTLDFLGDWAYGDIVGNLAAPEVMIVPAKLIRSAEKTLPRPEEPPRSVGFDEFNKALRSEDTVAQLTGFLESNSQSPLALEAYKILAAFAKREEFSKEYTQELAAKFEETAKIWGERLAPQAYFEFGTTLARQEYQPEIARKLLEQAQESLNEGTPDEWRVSLATGLISLGEFDPALELMQPLREKYPFDPMISFNLARALEAKGKDAEALDLYAAISVIPAQEDTVRQMIPEQPELLPSHRAEELYAKIEGSTDGYAAYLNKVYRREMTDFAEERKEPEEVEGHRTALMEIFTGSACPPCVAADAAAAALEVTYDEKDLIVLRFHQHIPLYDPLANEESQTRFSYYMPDQQGTPSTFLNGVMLDGFAGGMERAEGIYGSANKMVSEERTKTSEYHISLTAAAQDGEVSVTAEVTSDMEFSPTTRLRLALVEDEIDFEGMNGIRVHDGIVRAMLGGVQGIAPEEGKLTFDGKISLGDLKSDLAEQNAKVEALFKRQLAGRFSGEFPVQTPNFGKLRLVGFVQNERTHEVLQATSIPVSGETILLEAADDAAEGNAKPEAEKEVEEKPEGETNANETVPEKAATPN